MKKQILLFSFLGITTIQIVKAQCGVTPAYYPGVGSTTTTKVAVFSNANGCIQNSQIIDNGIDVSIGNGNLILSNLTKAYYISSDPVLWHNNITSNIYVGVNAGNSYNGGLNINNTLVGYTAGQSITDGYCNTLIGSSAGQAITTSNWNTCVGWNAGASLTIENGEDNTFVGHDAGRYTSGAGASGITAWGAHNSFFGDEAGKYNTRGNFNVGMGQYSLQNGTTGSYNSSLGYGAGSLNLIGHYNIYIGAQATCASGNLTNASAIGYHAIVKNSDQMILGGDYTDSSNVFHHTFVGIGLSNDGTGPLNQLEIKSQSGVSANLRSGLTFRNLKQGDPNGVTTHTQVLTVDGGGNVCLTDDNSSGGGVPNNGLSNEISTGQVQLGQNFTSPALSTSASLLHTSEIPMDNHDLYFTDPFGNIKGSVNNIGIGTTSPRGKVSIFRNQSKYLISNPTALYVENVDNDASPLSLAAGIVNETHSRNNYNYGIVSQAYGAYYGNMAGRFITNVPPAGASSPYSYNIGGYFEAVGAWTNFGVCGFAPFVDDYYSFSVGVYGNAPGYPVGLPQPALGTGMYAGYFNGDVAVTNNLWFPSDSTLKNNIQPLQNISLLLNQINCYSYTFDTTKFGKHINMPKTLQYGFLAQEVENIFPNMVMNGVLPPEIDSSGVVVSSTQPVKMIDYTHFIPLLLEGYKELSTRVNDLEAIVQSCCGANRNISNTEQNEPIQIKLSNSSDYILYQNLPNPYSTSTTIRYFIPENTNDVKITFQDATGKTLKEVQVNETGQGSINVDGSELISGTYTYSLVVSGKVIDTKKMVKVK